MSKAIFIIETPSGHLTDAIKYLIHKQLKESMPDYHCLIIEGTSDEYRYFLSSKEDLSVKQLKELKAISL